MFNDLLCLKADFSSQHYLLEEFEKCVNNQRFQQWHLWWCYCMAGSGKEGYLLPEAVNPSQLPIASSKFD